MEAESLERPCYIKMKQRAPNPQTGYNDNHLEGFCYTKPKQISPNPDIDFSHKAIVHPAPATREVLMNPDIQDLSKPKVPNGYVSCLSNYEDIDLREKSVTRNKIWHSLLYKKDYSKTDNELFCSNLMMKHRTTKSLHDFVLTRKPSDDVIDPTTSKSCSA